ncbi:hypothetical protein OUZ56_007683 [Daphnia magna]|uniref:Uncharacterized protein n=1 Tax=Daphnia magna TaxID=35525 RepID=A0ABR0AAP2_9CRUS|nr:hypothetical protein OUZ56_007683 [Daphnia magna]
MTFSVNLVSFSIDTQTNTQFFHECDDNVLRCLVQPAILVYKLRNSPFLLLFQLPMRSHISSVDSGCLLYRTPVALSYSRPSSLMALKEEATTIGCGEKKI